MFSTELIDETILLQEFSLEPASILLIEGKPGVGKSHLVNQLKIAGQSLLYRFWVSNQDVNYKARLE
ncbi:hypothetical protein R0K20_16610, partial [Staphylococcus sp. SIMBA_130]